MFKETVGLLIRLITQPAKEWSVLSDKQEINNEFFFKSYLYPLFGIVALFSFVGVFVLEDFNIQKALLTCIRLVVTVFVGYHLASFLLSVVMERLFNRPKEIQLCQRFVGYSSAMIYITFTILTFLPSLFFLYIFLLYLVYIIWEGAVSYAGIEEALRTKFTIWSSAVILFSPGIIFIIISLMLKSGRAL